MAQKKKTSTVRKISQKRIDQLIRNHKGENVFVKKRDGSIEVQYYLRDIPLEQALYIAEIISRKKFTQEEFKKAWKTSHIKPREITPTTSTFGGVYAPKAKLVPNYSYQKNLYLNNKGK